MMKIDASISLSISKDSSIHFAHFSRENIIEGKNNFQIERSEDWGFGGLPPSKRYMYIYVNHQWRMYHEILRDWVEGSGNSGICIVC